MSFLENQFILRSAENTVGHRDERFFNATRNAYLNEPGRSVTWDGAFLGRRPRAPPGSRRWRAVRGSRGPPGQRLLKTTFQEQLGSRGAGAFTQGSFVRRAFGVSAAIPSAEPGSLPLTERCGRGRGGSSHGRGRERASVKRAFLNHALPRFPA